MSLELSDKFVYYGQIHRNFHNVVYPLYAVFTHHYFDAYHEISARLPPSRHSNLMRRLQPTIVLYEVRAPYAVAAADVRRRTGLPQRHLGIGRVHVETRTRGFRHAGHPD